MNVQKPGGYVNPHVHADDALGAIFYVDAPPRETRLCYDDGAGTPQRARWEEFDPRMVRSLRGHGGRGYVEPAAGDLVIMPAGWLRHWVPPIEGDSVRTAVVLNLVCL